MSEERISIVIVLPDLRIGGGQRVLLELARRFKAAGHDVALVSLVNDGDLTAEIPRQVTFHALLDNWNGNRYSLFARALTALVTYLRRTGPDAVLSSMTGTNLLTAIAHQLAGRRGRLLLREAVSLHNTPHALVRRLISMVYGRADALVAVSEGVEAGLMELGLAREAIHVVSNPVDVKRLRRLAAEAVPTFETTRAPYVISVGRLSPQKDQRTLLRAYAASELSRSHGLLLVGDGEERAALHSLALDLQISDRVEFAGGLVNPYPLVAGAALHVLSSRWEGCPNVLLEALALGVPVVSTDCPAGPRELLCNGRYGRLVPVGDHVALATAMDAEIRSPAADRRQALTDHEPELVAARYLNLLLPPRVEVCQ